MGSRNGVRLPTPPRHGLRYTHRMKQFAVIGLGQFGGRLARNLAQAGSEVIAIDRSRSLVEAIKDDVTFAVALDATDEEALRGHNVHEVDAAIVSIGDNFEATALTTVTLKQIGVKRVISRSISSMGARILARIGADAVVNPEDESADRWTIRLVSPHFINHYELGEGVSLAELPTPADWVGKTLASLQLRSSYGIHVVAVKHEKPDEEGRARMEIPVPDEALTDDQVLILMGPDAELAKLNSREESELSLGRRPGAWPGGRM